MEYWGNQDIWNLILSTSKDIIPFRGTKHRGKASDILIAVQNDYLNGKYNSAQDALDHVAKQIHNATGLPIATVIFYVPPPKISRRGLFFTCFDVNIDRY